MTVGEHQNLYSNLFKHGMTIVKKYGKRTEIIYVILKVLKILRVECARILSGKPELEEQLTSKIFAETEIPEVPRELLWGNVSEAVSKLINDVNEGCNRIKEIGVETILDDDTIMTLGYSELVFNIMKYAAEKEKKFTVIVLEIHPSDGGKEMTNQLTKLGVLVFIVSERSLLEMFSKRAKVFIECEALYADGGLACNSENHVLCQIAQDNAVPVYMFLLSSRLSPLLSVDFQDALLCPFTGLVIYRTELIPRGLVSTLVTDLGSIHVTEFLSIRKDCFCSGDVRDFLSAL